MAERRVIIELRHSDGLADMALMSASGAEAVVLDKRSLPKLEGVAFDDEYSPVAVPGLVDREATDEALDTGTLLSADLSAEGSTYLVRGTMEEGDAEAVLKNKSVVGVYSDPEIQPMIVCPSSPPVGTDATVESLLCASALRRGRMDGHGVLVAVVDSGINMAYLNSRGKTPEFDAARSWVPRAGLVPGSLPVGHGTMCAFDVCIAAPRCTLLDIALLQSTARGPTVMAGFLSDAVRAYRHLIDVMTAPRRPGELRSLVVNNSWGMFHPSWDFPVGHPGNYSDNPNHPFNRIVGALEAEGADILFAAGNCGADCPDSRCQGLTAKTIYGANSHPAVLSVAGVDTTRARVGYSAIGPGRLTARKPDICGYTHFAGSGVYVADGGTSAACPVVAGVVAALRSVKPFDPGTASSRPAAIRTIMLGTATDLGSAGYDYRHGYGVVNGCLLARRYGRPFVISCRTHPWLCRDPRWWRIVKLCERYPWICDGIIRWPERGVPLPPPRIDREILRRLERGGAMAMDSFEGDDGEFEGEEGWEMDMEVGEFDAGEVSGAREAFLVGYEMGLASREDGSGESRTSGGGRGCGCDD